MAGLHQSLTSSLAIRAARKERRRQLTELLPRLSKLRELFEMPKTDEKFRQSKLVGDVISPAIFCVGEPLILSGCPYRRLWTAAEKHACRNPLSNLVVVPATPRPALSIAEFCKAHSISEGFFYKLKKQGEGPREMKVGARTLITL